MTDKLRIDVHAHLYPPGYLDTLRAGGPLSFGRDAEGREVLEMNGARVVTLTAEMQGLEQRLVDMDAYPHVIGDPKAAVETVEGLEIEEEEREAIFAGNLLGLLGGFRQA